MPASNNASPPPEGPSKPLFAGSLSEDLSRHLTSSSNNSTTPNGYAASASLKARPAAKSQAQPFNILTASGGKKYQPPTMRGAPSAGASTKPLSNDASNAILPTPSSMYRNSATSPSSSSSDAYFPNSGSPLSILTAARQPNNAEAASSSGLLPSALRMFGPQGSGPNAPDAPGCCLRDALFVRSYTLRYERCGARSS